MSVHVAQVTSACSRVVDDRDRWIHFPKVKGMLDWLVDHPVVTILIKIITVTLTGILLRYIIVRLVQRIVRQATTQRRSLLHRKRPGRAWATTWGGARGEQRANALGSLATSVITVIILGSTIIGILAAIGINVTPLLASAGVVGVALGFGAQNLVKDLLAGVGMLVEDQLGVGDVVDMEKASGTVESVGLRVTRLRDDAGVIWYVRNGEVLRVGNKSQGWSRIVLDVDVAYDTDLAAAEEVIARTVTEVADQPHYAPLIIDEPTVVGVEQITATAVTIRVLGTCAAGQNAAMEREMRVKIKEAFDGAGIKLAAAPV